MSAELSELRVLLVDDNQHMRAIVTAILRGTGVTNLREASDGARGLEILETWPADIAVVDFRMQPMDGAEFTRLVRNAPGSKNPYLPIIMMTGFAERQRVEEARDAGVSEFLVKPVTAQRLLDRINAVIYHPRPFVRKDGYFGPARRGIDDGPAQKVAVI